MLAPLASAALGSLPEIYKMIAGFRQTQKAKQLEKTPRPDFDIPDAAKEMLGTARMEYYDPRLPNQDYYSGRIEASTASAIRAAKEAGRTPAEILATAAAAQDNENDAFMQLAIKGTEKQQSDLNNLNSALGVMSGYQEKQWAWDKQKPYEDAMKAAAALRQSGNTNIYNGIKSMTSLGLQAFGAMDNKTTDAAKTSLTSGGINDIYSRYGVGETATPQNFPTIESPVMTGQQQPDNTSTAADPSMNWLEVYQLMQKVKGGQH